MVDADTDVSITPQPSTPQPSSQASNPEPQVREQSQSQVSSEVKSEKSNPTEETMEQSENSNPTEETEGQSEKSNPTEKTVDRSEKYNPAVEHGEINSPEPNFNDKILNSSSALVSSQKIAEDCDTATCDTQPEHSNDTHDKLETQHFKESNPDQSLGNIQTQEKACNPPIRRPSLLKTVVSIKSSEPVTVVNYEIVDTFDSIDFIDDGSSCGESPDKSKQFGVGMDSTNSKDDENEERVKMADEILAENSEQSQGKYLSIRLTTYERRIYNFFASANFRIQ